MKIEFVERFDIPSATAQQRGHGAHGRTWASPGLQAARAAWRALFEKYRPERPLSGAISVTMVLYYHRMGTGAGKRFPKTTRPDIDNVVKVVLDALMAAGIIADDAAVFNVNAWKFAEIGAEHVQFSIMECREFGK